MSGLPFLDVPERFGPVGTFGVLVALGVLFGGLLARRYARRNGLDDETLRWLSARVVAAGFVGALGLNAVFYEWTAFVADPWATVRGFGISSYGGAIAGTGAFLFFAWRRGLDRRRWADLLAYGAAGGWLLGRLGCALAHDHLGRRTDASLGVNVPAGRYPFERVDHTVRAHDLGLYEFFVWIALLAAVIAVERWPGRRPGLLVGGLAVGYSVPRFFLEFLRLPATDPRYAGLTFAQYSSIAALLAGVFLLIGGLPRRRSGSPA